MARAWRCLLNRLWASVEAVLQHSKKLADGTQKTNLHQLFETHTKVAVQTRLCEFLIRIKSLLLRLSNGIGELRCLYRKSSAPHSTKRNSS